MKLSDEWRKTKGHRYGRVVETVYIERKKKIKFTKFRRKIRKNKIEKRLKLEKDEIWREDDLRIYNKKRQRK